MKNFIIVDDDRISNFIAERIIRGAVEGSTIQTFENPVEAFESIRTNHALSSIPTLLLVDINMPEMNGWEFLAVLSASVSMQNFTTYILSSSVDPEDKTKAQSFAFLNGYIEKPFSKTKLRDALG